ncbi:MAG: hypothetical protein H8F28_09605 [Fibrella sp.]|nr:hypothetical protein [Armatimonadota bacterium]
MCIFSGSVESVSDTRIFARLFGKGAQFLAYDMRFVADEAVAMILPIPVSPGAGENAVRFLDLHHYTSLFDDLSKLFPSEELSVPVLRNVAVAASGTHASSAYGG